MDPCGNPFGPGVNGLGVDPETTSPTPVVSSPPGGNPLLANPTAPSSRDTRLATVLAIAIVTVVVATLVGGAALFALLVGITGPGTTVRPLVTLGSSVAEGNATLTVLNASEAHPPGTYRFVLQVEDSFSALTSLPVEGAPVSVLVGGTRMWVAWIDADGNGQITQSDELSVTGDVQPLPALSTYVFQLRWSDGALIAAVTWSTP